ncbi:MAG: response regulator transcription factor [Ancrocorticia sp.]|uniref:response regulator transcription factor n=1 Tax=Ancrocorticia sp. TaxID=2593684 RepID=UPI003F93AD02
MKPTVLVVDDEPQMVSIVTFAFETNDFDAMSATNGHQAWELLQHHAVDIVILDVMLPDMTGFELTQRIRAGGDDVPIILLTALANEKDRIRGLEAGADDYVSKPFSPRELALRAQAVLRRTMGGTQGADDVVVCGQLRLELRSERAWWNGQRIDLGATEFRVLATLAEHEGEIVGPKQLLNEAWATSATVGGREMIKTAVYRLRKHLEQVGGDPAMVNAVRGKGYRLVAS